MARRGKKLKEPRDCRHKDDRNDKRRRTKKWATSVTILPHALYSTKTTHKSLRGRRKRNQIYSRTINSHHQSTRKTQDMTDSWFRLVKNDCLKQGNLHQRTAGEANIQAKILYSNKFTGGCSFWASPKQPGEHGGCSFWASPKQPGEHGGCSFWASPKQTQGTTGSGRARNNKRQNFFEIWGKLRKCQKKHEVF
jgi:hypothetical protein